MKDDLPFDQIENGYKLAYWIMNAINILIDRGKVTGEKLPVTELDMEYVGDFLPTENELAMLVGYFEKRGYKSIQRIIH